MNALMPSVPILDAILSVTGGRNWASNSHIESLIATGAPPTATISQTRSCLKGEYWNREAGKGFGSFRRRERASNPDRG